LIESDGASNKLTEAKGIALARTCQYNEPDA